MSRVVELVACDIDGTLMPRDGRPSARVLRALADAGAAGLRVILATGRPPRWAFLAADELDHSGLVICAQGAVCWDQARRRVANADVLSAADLHDVHIARRRLFPGGGLAMETLDRLLVEPVLVGDPLLAGGIGASIEVMGSSGELVAKLLVRGPGSSAPCAAEEFRAALAGNAAVYDMRSEPLLLEVRRPGVDKASALATIACDLGLSPRQVAAIGNTPSDNTMIEWAGVGIAMADGHSSTVECCDLVAPSLADDGAAIALERLANGVWP
jgi:hydroxymethylpyrimidine pyrophosphatase-like HAD family hydrolase